ncbi:hypothetical protein NYZ99_05785 [Maribacter litopenaei]|uniref:Uncharacterized protein n=1 Tax=Maribacter litopenaei TaxID=2976127 RepID=A0ABY5YCP7_9FLAO|nr:hypothetical protein [Maribacter litopenaei]UWX55895.1 hypothetical protein NYZ99_05785 [Maribacter litopenaei]
MKRQKFIVSIVVVLVGIQAFCQNSIGTLPNLKENVLSIHSNVQERANKIFDSLVKIRRDFHRYPRIV